MDKAKIISVKLLEKMYILWSEKCSVQFGREKKKTGTSRIKTVIVLGKYIIQYCIQFIYNF